MANACCPSVIINFFQLQLLIIIFLSKLYGHPINVGASIDYPNSGVAYAWKVVPHFLFRRPWQALLVSHITLSSEPGDVPVSFRVLLATALRAY